MTDIDERISIFNAAISDMFEDQRDILRESNILFIFNDISEWNKTVYLWHVGHGYIQFYRTYDSITTDGYKRKLGKYIYIQGLPDVGWWFDHRKLKIVPNPNNGSVVYKYDRQLVQ